MLTFILIFSSHPAQTVRNAPSRKLLNDNGLSSWLWATHQAQPKKSWQATKGIIRSFCVCNVTDSTSFSLHIRKTENAGKNAVLIKIEMSLSGFEFSVASINAYGCIYSNQAVT